MKSCQKTENLAPRSICLLRLSALGDVVLVLPLIRALQATWPGVQITWIVGKGAYPLVSGLEAEGVELVVIDKPKGLGDYLRLRKQFRNRCFDALLCLQASWRANWIYPCIRAKRKIGYSSDRARDFHSFFVGEQIEGSRPHLVDGFMQFAEHLGMPRPSTVDWRMPLDTEAVAWAETSLPKAGYLALSPCASKAERDWPLERYCSLAKNALELGYGPLVLLGGKSEREQKAGAAILAALPADAPVLNLMGATSIPKLVAVLSRCGALVSPDTGAVHIANALGRPVVGLYAVAPASRTGPYGNTGYCVDVFEQGVRELLGKDPARVPWSQRVHDPRAMGLISEQAVLAALAAAYSKA